MKLFIYFIFALSLLYGCSSDSGSSGSGDPDPPPPTDPIVDSPAADLLITEVSSTKYYNINHWIEVYNNSTSDIDISTYKLGSGYINPSSGIGNRTLFPFPLPAVTISPGEYLVLYTQASATYQGFKADNNSAVIALDLGDTPYWDDNGTIELVNSAGETEDYVCFGTLECQAPTSGDSFEYSVAPITRVYGKSIARAQDLTDTNAGADWSLVEFSTPGGPNDVNNCSADADGDGIPDCAEASGKTFAGLPLYDWGARAGTPDIFVELDYMHITGGETPEETALQNIKDVFQVQGYAVHFDVGNLFSNNGATVDATRFDLNGGNQVTASTSLTLGKLTNFANLYELKTANMDIARKQIFHYVVMGGSQMGNGSCGSSGLGEVNGNDFIVTLGGCGFASASNSNINAQASTLMHELGHNLGLRHGGDVNDNYKPNYASIMNYLYSFKSAPIITVDNDLMYRYEQVAQNGGTCGAAVANHAWANNLTTATFNLSYSPGGTASLNELNLDETVGLEGVIAIDFNCNGVATDVGFARDINFNGTQEVLNDYNDWQNLDFFFGDNSSGQSYNVNGFVELPKDRIGNDRQPLSDDQDFRVYP